MPHEITRLRHETRRRHLEVRRTERLTPGLLRIVLAGEDLAGFTSGAPDDHVKLFVEHEGELVGRDYTPRHFDEAAGELLVDFALHEAGPATRWAMEARPGDHLQIGGPRGSTVVPADFDWWLLVGDETAIPAIARRLDEMGEGVPVTTLVAVADASEEPPFATAARHTSLFVHRPLAAADDPAPILSALDDWSPPAGDGFVWIAAEATVARAVRARVQERGHPAAWLRASGYWRKGVGGVHDKLEG